MSKLPYALCNNCPLYDEGPAVPGFGPKDPKVVFVGEAPGQQEAAEGIPFVGQSGQLLDAALADAGVLLPETFMFKTNVVACRPPGNREPTQHEVECCKPRLAAELRDYEGVNLVTLGKTAHEAFGVPHNQIGGVFERKGRNVMPCWHPAYILRSPDRASEFLTCIRRTVEGPFQTNLIPWPEVRTVSTASALAQALEECPDDAWVSADIETDQVQWFDSLEQKADAILMLQLAWSLDFAIVVPDDLLYDVPEVRGILQEFFRRVRIVGQNFKFDAVFLKSHLGISTVQSFDTMLAHYLLDENTSHGLKEFSTLLLGIPDYEAETIMPYLRSKNDRYSKAPFDVLAKYGCMDVVVVLYFRPIFEKRLRDEGLWDLFNNIIMESANVLTQAELRGFKVDFEQLDWLTGPEAFGGEINRLTKAICEAADEPELNPNSTVQLSAVFYDKLCLPMPKGRKIKPRSTGKEALEKLRGQHPIVDALAEYRRVSKMNSSYALNLRRQVDVHHRVHATFNIPGTEIGRLSVSRPALQTIPRASDYYGSMIRSAFIAGVGKVLLICDYSQAELRVFACLSGEPFLLKVYADGRDLHSEVAIGMYGAEFTKEQRVQCKMFNFSYLYGGTEYSFAQDAGLDINIARQFVRDYNRLMPIGLAWKKEQFERLKKDGYVESYFGRRRRFPILTTSNLEDARKSCVHMPVASTANDLTLMSGNRLERAGVPVVLEVHDSVICEVDETDAEEAGKLMKKVMVDVAVEHFPQIPWVVDLDVSHRWAEPKNA